MPEGEPTPPAPRGYARMRERDDEARARLAPLAPGERPRVLVVAAGVAVALAVANLLTTALSEDPDGGQLAFAGVQAAVLLLVAAGIWRKRYLAVLAFQALLAFQILVFTTGILLGNRVLIQIAFAVLVLALGWLFWRLVPTLARLQMPGR